MHLITYNSGGDSTHFNYIVYRSCSPCIWALKLKDPATASQFQSSFKANTMTAAAAVATGAGADADAANHTESAGSKLKGLLLDAVTVVCVLSKNCHWKYETWWWNEQVDEAIPEKRARFKANSALEKGGMAVEAKGAKTAYIDAKCKAKHAIWLPKSEAEEFATVSPDGVNVFCITKQMDHTDQDVVGESCVWNDAGELALTDEDKMKAC